MPCANGRPLIRLTCSTRSEISTLRSRVMRRRSSSSGLGAFSMAQTPRLAALEGEQGPDERLAVETVGLRPATATRSRNRGRIDYVAFDTLTHQRTVDPEPVETGFLDHDDREMAARARLRLLPELRKAHPQAGNIPAGNGMARHLLSTT